MMKSKLFSFSVMYILFTYVTCTVGNFQKTVTYYQTIHADHVKHNIVKRGIKESNHPYNKIKELSFNTLGKDFRLILTPKRGILHSEFTASSVNENGEETPIPVDHEGFYEGRLFGETDSSANVHIDDGVMTANIDVGGETYHIEPSWRHLPGTDNRTMVAYKGSGVRFSWEHPNTHEDNIKPCSYIKEGSELETDDDEEEFFNLTMNGNSTRHKRAINSEQRPGKTRCPLLLVADYRFYQEMGASDTKITINYLISLIDRVHKIYNDTTWQEDESYGFNGMGFVIKKILVHSEPTRTRTGEVHYNMMRQKWDVRTLLEIFSREFTHKDYCLAHLFTDMKFEGGILGLAYVGSPRRNSVGGICTPEYFKNGYTLYLNSGLSSSRNHYGQRVITREADLVTAHEFGHNWGSEHDPDIPECSPSASKGGSYLMYTYSVSGYDINNKKFSPCSVRSIRKVLQAKAGRCFSETQESFCGNLRVEKNEECDAGLLGTEDNDRCCNKFCKLRKKQGVVCSDKNSPCCLDCQYMQKDIKCREAQHATCEQEAMCTGQSEECPRSKPMPDGTACLEKGKCKNGQCVPYCETQGMQSCMCDNLMVACIRCCRKNLNDTCFPIDPNDILPDGTPCIQGFCNKGVCEKTIQDVVERFWDIIEEISINKVLVFLRDNIVGTVILVSGLLWIPASCLVSYVDRKRLKKERMRRDWTRNEQQMYISTSEIYGKYPKKVIRAWVPHQPNT